MIVIDQNGVEGTVVDDAALSPALETRLLVRFQNGKQVIVPKELLNRQEDGRYRLAASIEELATEQAAVARADTTSQGSIPASQDATGELPLVIPIVEERVQVQKRASETGRVELHKTVHEHTEVVDQPLQIEEVEIERVAVNRLVEEPVPIRHEGDTMIISLLEEVLVVEKRLVLREEVHVKKVRKEVHDPQEVLLRQEQVEVIRTPVSHEAMSQEQ
ncbi:MAG: YsnF/AvaK domain-containing protein [Caldilineaceae bacterium]|nr:YsnF/AvaK domain-containing protein [Caldilineaceae bacterium]